MKRPAVRAQAGDAFVRGCVATALLAVVQPGVAKGRGRDDGRRILRLTLQGGTALAAGAVVSEALQRRDWLGAAAALAGGAAGLAALEHLLEDNHLTERRDGQEERQETLEEGRLGGRRDERQRRPRAGTRQPARQ